MKHNPFAGLREQLGLPDPPAPEPQDSGTPEPRDLGTPGPRNLGTSEPRHSGTSSRAVVRYERAGRGGKEVTVVEQLTLSQAELSAWLKSFKASLGCGGVIEGTNLVLQGDHRKRLPALLTAKGVKRISG
ncbi:MAG: hypothetical protein AMXMBFR57_25840 [Acidimicrobiia bacterium]